MIRKHIFKDKANNGSVRWQLHEPTRVEAFSDAVFAFALTLVVISLEVPKTFGELLHMMQGFIGFAICFLFLVLIWHDQYIFFRRYGLQDTTTTCYNFVLLFMVIYLVYPLKFLFYALSQGFENNIVVQGQTIERFKNMNEVCRLMIIYDVGYFIIYSIMALMYKQALKRKKDIMLTRLEVYNTKTYIMEFIGRIGVVVLSLIIAVVGLYHDGYYAFYSGMIYSFIGLVMWTINARRKGRITHLFSHEEIEEIKNEVIVFEKKEI